MDGLGPWVLGTELGRGAEGVVWRCHHRDQPDRVGALKLAHARPRDPRHAARQLALLRALDHPGVLPVWDAGEREGQPWIVSPLAEGTSVLALRTDPPQPEAVVLSVGAQLAEILAHAHARGVWHRDLKPANLVVRPDGRLVVLDFGCAAAGFLTALTATGDRAPGTPEYAPPEWFLADGDPAAHDLYALGVLLVELLDGRPAFAPMLLDDLVEHKLAGPLRPERGPAVVAALAMALTDPDPTRRPGADEARAVLAPWAAPIAPVSDATWAPEVGPSVPAPVARVGRYEVLGELGRGGMGVVYRARDPELQREVAVKVAGVAGSSRGRAARVDHLLSEARAIARFDHPNLVRVLDAGRHDGGVFFAMELVDGPDLGAVLRERGTPPLDQALAWTLAIGRALAHAHAAGVVHRDVKPGNVLLDPSGSPRLTDLGLAVEAHTGAAAAGTPGYMAPEQAHGDEVGPQADVYGLGAVLYELLTGTLPHGRGHALQLLHRTTTLDPPPVRSRAPGLPADLDDVLRTALDRDPARRYPDAGSLCADLERVRRGEPVACVPQPLRRRLGWQLRRRRTAVVVLGVAIAAVGLVVGVPAARRALRERDAASRLEVVEARIDQARAEGDEGRARELFDAFVTLPANEGTAALGRAWLWRADRDGDVESLLEAYAVSTRAADQREALLRVAQRYEQEGLLDELAGVLAIAGQRGLVDEGFDRVLAALEVASRRPVAPDRLGTADDLAPLVGLLAHVTTTAHLVRDVLVVGDDAVVIAVDPEGRAARLARDLGAATPLDLPSGTVRAVRGPGPPWVAVVGAADVQVGEVAGATFRSVMSWPGPERIGGHGLARADLDRDGRPELYIGHGDRRVTGMHLDEGGTWVPFEPLPEFRWANSAPVALDAVDAGAALAVATRGWGLYDARVYGAPVSDEGRPSRWTRVRAGSVSDVAGLRGPQGWRVLAPVGGPIPNRDVWPASLGPDGPPPVVRVIEADGTTTQVVAGPHGGAVPFDADGDGVDEVALARGYDLVLAREGTAGWVTVRVGHARALGAADIDGDGDQELLVSVDGRLHALGAGEDLLPGWVPAVQVAEAPPAGAGALASEIQRAEDLCALGFGEDCADRLARLADLAADPDLAATLQLRSAALAASQGRTELAVERYLRAADRIGPPGRQAAADTLRAAGEPDRALELAPDDPVLQALAAVPALTVVGAEGLSPVAQVADPMGARLEPGAGLWLTPLGPEPVLEVPLRFDGPRLGVDLSLDLLGLEWAGGLVLELTDADGGEVVTLVTYGHGGGGVVQTTLHGSAGAGLVRNASSAPAPVLGELRLRAEIRAEDGSAVITLEAPWGTERVAGRRAAPLAAGPMRLVVRAKDPDIQSVAELRITSLVLRGLTPVPSSPSGLARAARALVLGAPQEALAELPEEPEADRLRVLALDDLGRWGETTPVLARMMRADPEGTAAWARRALRLRGEPLGRMVMEALGSEAAAEAWWGLELVARGPTPDPRLVRALTAGPLAEVHTDDVDLLRARARSWSSLGKFAIVADQLEEAWAATRTAEAGPERDRTLTAILLERAALHTARGDRVPAMEDLRQALATSAVPDLTADLVRADPRFTPLHDLDAWGELVLAASPLPGDPPAR
ncbi:MAG: protein kinase [Alphaproteobacteria bacterium]|nr:protein kinase [Alphaproteobacteria bacterium]